MTRSTTKRKDERQEETGLGEPVRPRGWKNLWASISQRVQGCRSNRIEKNGNDFLVNALGRAAFNEETGK
jgi:hypothetical protein